MKGIICLWGGAIVDIPTGWHLCDGNAGTPDLRNKFVIGAGDTYAPEATGGESSHDHLFTGDAHHANLDTGVVIDNVAPGGNMSNITADFTPAGTVEPKSTLPPYYALAFIIKL